MKLAEIVAESSLLVDGEFCLASHEDTIPVIDPATREIVSTTARGTEEDIDLAVQSSRRALEEWSRLSPTERGRILYRWAEAVSDNLDVVARLEAREVGKPLEDARANAAVTAQFIRYYAGAADKLLGTTVPTVSSEYFGFTLREPLGVCAIIIPWNAPAALMASSVAPALSAGNTVVLKPSEDAPLTPLLIARMALEAGLPPGVLNVVPGYGHEAGAALVDHPDINHISFTGSIETGKRIMRAAANLVPVKLELGGKTPHILFEDCDVERAVATAVKSITRNSGQICQAGSRLLVHSGLLDKVDAVVTTAMESTHLGVWDENADMGPLINEDQYDKVLSYIEEGRKQGARTITGGGVPADERLRRGFFVQPTAFDHVTRDMRIAREEIFGPVLSILAYEDEQEAIEIANSTPYGLMACVWTNDLRRAHRLARALKAGQVTINQHGAGGAIGLPFGGYNKTGIGKVGGTQSLLEYTQEKGVSMFLG